MDVLRSAAYATEERKKLQNRLAQRRRRLRIKARQSQNNSEANHLPGSLPSSRPTSPSRARDAAQSRCPPAIHRVSGLSEDGSAPFPICDFEQVRDSHESAAATASPAIRQTAWSQQGDLGGATEASPGPFITDSFTLEDVFPVVLTSAGQVQRSTPRQHNSPVIPPSLHPSWNIIELAALPSVTESSSSGCQEDQGPFESDVEQGLEIIMDETFNMGFDSLEAMVISYYTHDFDKNSTVGQAQRLSRKRHIRTLISALSHSARHWVEDEAYPLREEILKSAEALYAADVQRLRSLWGLGSMRGPSQLLKDGISRWADSNIEGVVYRDLCSEVSDFVLEKITT
ncbi:hypothetical protein DL767_004714 [Monosporascus sp. MG133]|nr:hypothetical protein DL767_004714 [Monosporascus sp. MG133]